MSRLFDGRYAILAKLASGGMADVYLARDEILDRQVALKLLHSDLAKEERFIERFRREAARVASLDHAHIVRVFDRAESEGRYYIAMEYVPGGSLADLLHASAPLDIESILSLTRQILEALAFAHSKGVIHRDVKPGNLLLDEFGVVKVTDFGIALWEEEAASRLTDTGFILGTASYLSPEQALGAPVQASSDLYSLGVVMYEMATGRLPFDGDNPVAVALQHVRESPSSPRDFNPELPGWLERVILRAMAKDPNLRHQSARAFLADLPTLRRGHEPTVPLLAGGHGGAAQGASSHGSGRSPQVGDPRVAGSPRAQAGDTRVRGMPRAGVGWRRPPGRTLRWAGVLALAFLIFALTGAVALLPDFPLNRSGAGQPGGGTVGSEPAEVMDLTGRSTGEAVEDLARAGLRAAGTPALEPCEEKVGSVCRQDPKAGEALPEEGRIALWVSTGLGEPTLQVPDLIGLTHEQALLLLHRRDLNADIEFAASDLSIGAVVEQDPAAGESLAAGSTVMIVVGGPRDSRLLPPVVGLPEGAALQSLQEAGFFVRLRHVTPGAGANSITADAVQPGAVAAQVPGPGSVLEPGDTVILTVTVE